MVAAGGRGAAGGRWRAARRTGREGDMECGGLLGVAGGMGWGSRVTVTMSGARSAPKQNLGEAVKTVKVAAQNRD